MPVILGSDSSMRYHSMEYTAETSAIDNHTQEITRTNNDTVLHCLAILPTFTKEAPHISHLIRLFPLRVMVHITSIYSTRCLT